MPSNRPQNVPTGPSPHSRPQQQAPTPDSATKVCPTTRRRALVPTFFPRSSQSLSSEPVSKPGLPCVPPVPSSWVAPSATAGPAKPSGGQVDIWSRDFDDNAFATFGAQ
eukprot:661581-Alexandrium_andersonii.AAC.1